MHVNVAVGRAGERDGVDVGAGDAEEFDGRAGRVVMMMMMTMGGERLGAWRAGRMMMRGMRLQKLPLHLWRLPPPLRRILLPLLPRLELAQRLRRRPLPEQRTVRLRCRRRGRQRLGRRPRLQARLQRFGMAVAMLRRRSGLRLGVAARTVPAHGVRVPVAIAAEPELIEGGADDGFRHLRGGIAVVGVARVEEGVAEAAGGEAAVGAVARVGALEVLLRADLGLGGVVLVAVDGHGAVRVVEVVGEVFGFGFGFVGAFGGGGFGEGEAGVGEVEHGAVVVAGCAFEEGDGAGVAVAVGVEVPEFGVYSFGGGFGVFETFHVGDVVLVRHVWFCDGWGK